MLWKSIVAQMQFQCQCYRFEIEFGKTVTVHRHLDYIWMQGDCRIHKKWIQHQKKGKPYDMKAIFECSDSSLESIRLLGYETHRFIYIFFSTLWRKLHFMHSWFIWCTSWLKEFFILKRKNQSSRFCEFLIKSNVFIAKTLFLCCSAIDNTCISTVHLFTSSRNPI